MTNASTRNSTEKMFMGNPARPSANLLGTSTSPRRRLSVMQDMDTMYDESRAPMPMEDMMLNAIVEPMLIRESRMAMV